SSQLQQNPLLRQLFEWRDQKARDLDESPHRILPDHHLLALTQYSSLSHHFDSNLFHEYIHELQPILSNTNLNKRKIQHFNGIIPSSSSSPPSTLMNSTFPFRFESSNDQSNHLFSTDQQKSFEEDPNAQLSLSKACQIFQRLKKEPVLEFIAQMAGKTNSDIHSNSNVKEADQKKKKKKLKSKDNIMKAQAPVSRIQGSSLISQNIKNVFELPRKPSLQKRKATLIESDYINPNADTTKKDLTQLGPVLQTLSLVYFYIFFIMLYCVINKLIKHTVYSIVQKTCP
ncbi:hypothetical protein RFI_28565, partial [Reticulomyxa filosa]